MAYPDDLEERIKGDHVVWNDVETIAYFSKIAERPPPTGVPIAGTLWLMIKKTFLPENSPLINMDLTVEIPGENLVPLNIVPKANDIMQRGDGTRWVIKLVEIPAGIDYRVHVIKGTK